MRQRLQRRNQTINGGHHRCRGMRTNPPRPCRTMIVNLVGEGRGCTAMPMKRPPMKQVVPPIRREGGIVEAVRIGTGGGHRGASPSRRVVGSRVGGSRLKKDHTQMRGGRRAGRACGERRIAGGGGSWGKGPSRPKTPGHVAIKK
jgi:hypothetical protein